MKITPYFSNIRSVIIEELSKAEKSIDIAVAWFTCHELFNVLLKKKSNRCHVRLVVLNDDINNNSFDGIDFQKLITAGHSFYFANPNIPIHNKFCIIDNKTVITGSYNYTYYAELKNKENIVVISGDDELTNAYKKEFEDIISHLSSVKNVKRYLKQNPYAEDIMSYKKYNSEDKFQHSIELKNSGDIEQAKKIQNSIKDKTHLQTFRYKIKDVKYRSWKPDYFCKMLCVDKEDIYILFETPIDSGGYIWGVDLPNCWCIRDSYTKTNVVKATSIQFIKLNNEVKLKSLGNNEICYFSNNPKMEITDDFLKENGLAKQPNGQIITEDGKTVTTTYFGYKKRDKLSCIISFNKKKIKSDIIDLIEGINSDTKENHWHCFDINLNINRIPLEGD